MKKLIAYINCENETSEKIVNSSRDYENNGADELFLYSHTENEEERESFFEIVREISRRVDIPIIIGCMVKRFEDIKKAFYTGAKYVVLRYCDIKDNDLLKQGFDRFGKDSLIIESNRDKEGPDGFLADSRINASDMFGRVLMKHVTVSDKLCKAISGLNVPVIIRDSLIRNDIESILSLENVEGLATNFYRDKKLPGVDEYSEGAYVAAGSDIMKVKRRLKENGIDVNAFDSKLSFADLKLNSDGMVPVVVQDYKNNQVLMVAYMNEEAFNLTIETGIMTYFSRSRQELWIKGATSGHTQYVKELIADCDQDTILAKVNQVGAACHTGSRSCFFNEMLKHEYEEKNAYEILSNLYSVVEDRKKNPKEGSYTNYLFDKGIDKILKKCGEESAEMIIAAKNPNAEELKYEIADLLYHMTVLMVECGVDWNDVMQELANR